MNHAAETILHEAGLLTASTPFYRGRPILITENDYIHKLFDGDTGIILPAHETTIAITIHKRQGSEFDKVLMVLPPEDTMLLTRELIYTGISRIRLAVAEHGGTELELCYNDFFTATFRAKSIMATGGEIGRDIELTERQRDVLNLIQATPMLSAKALADRFGINKSAVEKHLNALKKKGVLRRVGGTRGYWQVLEENDE